MLCALEVKTCYSILSSLNRIDILTKKAKEMGYSSLAITDLNNMFGVYEFYLACLNNDIKPIIGIEVLFDDKRFILLAKNNNGYRNLIKIATIISDREITFDDLKIYSKDIILIIPYSSYNEKITNFFDEYYIGYTSVEERDKVKDKGVLITDISYIEKNDYKYLDYLLMIKDDKKLGEMELNTYAGKHLLDKEEFNNLTNDIVRSNMKYICDECNVTFEKRDGLLPIYNKDVDSFEYLNSLYF